MWKRMGVAIGVVVVFFGMTAQRLEAYKAKKLSMALVKVDVVEREGRPYARVYGHVMAQKFAIVDDVTMRLEPPSTIEVSVIGSTPNFLKPIPKADTPKTLWDFSLADKDPDAFRQQHPNEVARWEQVNGGPVFFDRLFPLDGYPKGEYEVVLRSKKSRQPITTIRIE